MILQYIAWVTTKGKVLAVMFSVGVVSLAAAEATSNRTLIVISICGNMTAVLIALLGAAVSIYNNRKILALGVAVDGMTHELTAAKVGEAGALGELKERDRQLGSESNREITKEGDVQKMEIVNPRTNPVPTIPVKDVSKQR